MLLPASWRRYRSWQTCRRKCSGLLSACLTCTACVEALRPWGGPRAAAVAPGPEKRMRGFQCFPFLFRFDTRLTGFLIVVGETLKESAVSLENRREPESPPPGPPKAPHLVERREARSSNTFANWANCSDAEMFRPACRQALCCDWQMHLCTESRITKRGRCQHRWQRPMVQPSAEESYQAPRPRAVNPSSPVDCESRPVPGQAAP